jgi:pimeloyl-ACP methyl ester carboxylesterase
MTPLSQDAPVFLYFCGNAGNLSDREEMMTRAAAAGLQIVAFDYRGTGQSQGRATEETVNRDASEIYKYVLQSLNVDSSRIILWGHSIGGAVATELGRKHPPAGIVLEGTFRSGEAMAKRLLPFLPVSWFMTYKFDNEGNVCQLSCPCLFIHGSRDFTIPVKDSEHLHRIAQNDKELWIVEGADHNDIYEVASSEFFPRLLQFGQRVAGKPAPAN